MPSSRTRRHSRTRRSTRRTAGPALALLFLLILPLTVPGCLLDFDQFEIPEGSGAMAGAEGTESGGGDSGGSTPGGGSSPSGTGGVSTGGTTPGEGGAGGRSDGGNGSGGRNLPTGGAGGNTSGGTGGDEPGGAPGTGGMLNCDPNTKICDGMCTPLDEPETGCAEAGCQACTALPGADSSCAQGKCALGSCQPGFFDCDGEATTGCEHSPSTFSEFACGGCNADCTSLGLSNCQSGLCGCATASECKGNANNGFDCQDRRCTCGGDRCNPGETCRRAGGSARCRCDSDTACKAGWTCCPTKNGPACKELDGSDASNCGACGVQCATGQSCVGGVCQ